MASVNRASPVSLVGFTQLFVVHWSRDVLGIANDG